MDHTGMELDRMDLEDYRAGRPLRSARLRPIEAKVVSFDEIIADALKSLTEILNEPVHTRKARK